MSDGALEKALMTERLIAERVMGTGTVKWFNLEEGCGCISPDEGDEDLRVEAASIEGGVNMLVAGARVEFEVDVGHSGLQAFHVISVRAS